MIRYPCAGIIVFHHGCIVLVKRRKGNYSFPKGKKENGEDALTTAWRELQEETGLTSNNVSLLDGYKIYENRDNHRPSIEYFVGYITQSVNQLTFNQDELLEARWIPIRDALQINGNEFYDRRKNILRNAYTFTLGKAPYALTN